VITEGSIGPIGREAVAKRTIRPESRAGIDPRMGIYVPRVGKVKHNRPHVLIAGVGQQIVTARWRKSRMALGADLLLDFLVKIVVMARGTLVMSGPLKYHGALFLGYMAGVAIQADFFQMVLVQVKRLLRLFWRIGRGGATSPSLLAICLQSCT